MQPLERGRVVTAGLQHAGDGVEVGGQESDGVLLVGWSGCGEAVDRVAQEADEVLACSGRSGSGVEGCG
ncbi:hypothetical protein [Streptomyces tendae]|uniref:hypothetical protein n=1 Tax=Streptomyces tendae TaxID=1932 RepID=UPI00249131A0|nr:hypothetical protein [Streptomyces tendae]